MILFLAFVTFGGRVLVPEALRYRSARRRDGATASHGERDAMRLDGVVAHGYQTRLELFHLG